MHTCKLCECIGLTSINGSLEGISKKIKGGLYISSAHGRYPFAGLKHVEVEYDVEYFILLFYVVLQSDGLVIELNECVYA